MTNLSKWHVSIEYGPTSADIHHTTVDASNIFEARAKAEKYAVDNKFESPMISEPYQDDYDEFLEWTESEEEEFTNMIEHQHRFDE